MAGTGFQWDPYAAPNMTPAPGAEGNFNFWRPADSKLPTGQALQQYLLGGNGTPGAETNRTVKYDGGLTREMLGNGFTSLTDNIGDGFGQIMDQAQYGGIYGQSQNRNYSPQSGNWGQSGFAGSNPFMINTY